MDPDTALELVNKGVTLLLLDVPQYTLLGIDTQVLYTITIFFFFHFFVLFGFTYVYSSINQCGRCFLLDLLLRASR